jgi:hypothetical protein
MDNWIYYLSAAAAIIRATVAGYDMVRRLKRIHRSRRMRRLTPLTLSRSSGVEVSPNHTGHPESGG